MPSIHVKQYEHYNRAFGNWDSARGKYVSSKAHYEQLMRENGMVSNEDAVKLGINRDIGSRKKYTLKPDTRRLISSLRDSADSKGNVRLSGKQREELLKRKLKSNPQALKELGLD